jgi:hypothetical protein
VTIIASRQAPALVVELADAIAAAEVVIKIVVDRSVDPPEVRVMREQPGRQAEMLMINPGDDESLSLVDLAQILDRLGFPVDYEEM